MATIENLPVEVVNHIAGGLEDLKDLVRFRGTSRRIYYATQTLFANRMQSIPWPLMPRSLRVLDEVADHLDVGGRFRALRLGSHYIPAGMGVYGMFTVEFQGAHDKESLDALVYRYKNYKSAAYQQEAFVYERRDLRILTSIIGRLGNLEHVEITDGQFVPPDVSSQFQISEAESCYAMASFKRETGVEYSSTAHPDPFPYPEDFDLAWGYNGLGYNFSNLLEALAATKRQITSLRVWHWDKHHKLDFVPIYAMPSLAPAGSDPERGCFMAGLAVSLANLKSLSLMVRYSPSPAPGQVTEQDKWLGDLVHLTPRLRCLRLMFDNAVNQDVLNHAVQLEAFSMFSHRLRLRRLEVLELTGVTVRIPDLLRVFERVRATVKVARLNTIATDGDWFSFFRKLQALYTPNYYPHAPAGTPMPQRVQLCFSWLMQAAECDADGEFRDGVVIFNRDRLEKCKRCRKPVAPDCPRRFCNHVSFRCDIDLHQMADGPTEGFKILLGAQVEPF